MQPGDNYRIVAGVGTLAQMPPLKAKANDVEEGTPRSRVWRQVGEAWTPLPEAGPSDWLESGALTVWRKLYVEVDSMGTPQYQGTSTALTPYVLTDTTRNWPDSDFNKFRPEDGKWKLKPNAAQQSAYAVMTSYPDHVSAYVHPPDDTLLTHASQGDPYLIFYDGFAPAQPEDDPAHDPADVPDPPWAAFGPALLPCYLVVDVLPSPAYCQSDKPWHHTLDDDTIRVPDRSALDYLLAEGPHGWRQSIPSAGWWSIYMAGAYDYQGEGEDNDPNDEHATLGITLGDDPGTKVSLVFYEVIRDVGAPTESDWTAEEIQRAITAVALHEGLHQFGLGHHHLLDANGIPVSVMFETTYIAQQKWWGTITPLGLRPSEVHIIRSGPGPSLNPMQLDEE